MSAVRHPFGSHLLSLVLFALTFLGTVQVRQRQMGAAPPESVNIALSNTYEWHKAAALGTHTAQLLPTNMASKLLHDCGTRLRHSVVMPPRFEDSLHLVSGPARPGCGASTRFGDAVSVMSARRKNLSQGRRSISCLVPAQSASALDRPCHTHLGQNPIAALN